MTEASLNRLPPRLRLLVAVTCYWMQRAQPCPGERLLRALLLGVTNGDALRRQAGIKHKHVLTAEVSLISGLFSVITLSDKSLCVCVCVCVCVCLADLQIQNQKLDVGVAHAFSQWQVCMKDSIHLNQLLGYPLPEPQIAK